MKIIGVLLLATLVAGGSFSARAQEMNKEEWQKAMQAATQERDELTTKIRNLEETIRGLEGQTGQARIDYERALDELYALVGSNRTAAAEYAERLGVLEANADALARLTDAELLARSGEVEQLTREVKGMWENKLSLLPEFWDRLSVLNERVNGLNATLGGSSKVYTVGTWSRDRDCLWNISKKPEIYDNAWLWPKIWQGNRDQIKDPDLIYPGQKLKIPPKGELNDEEKAALQRYKSRSRVPLP
jgi:nucleoid-associated protein YgaU